MSNKKHKTEYHPASPTPKNKSWKFILIIIIAANVLLPLCIWFFSYEQDTNGTRYEGVGKVEAWAMYAGGKSATPAQAATTPDPLTRAGHVRGGKQLVFENDSLLVYQEGNEKTYIYKGEL